LVKVPPLLLRSIISLDPLASNYIIAYDVVLARTSPIFDRKIYFLVPSYTDMY
jgi:hypothetical protein